MVGAMSQRTVLNEQYKGLVETMSIPVKLQDRDGKKFASFGSVVPIHSCTPEEVEERSKTTHHYCDVFTEQALAPLGELVYVRVDENTAEKVFINRSKRLLLVSSDGVLAQWRCAPTFESANQFVAGTPIVNKDGELVSVVTAKRGNHYAVSNVEGDGGYFATSKPWLVLETPAGAAVYGDQTFPSREELRAFVAKLTPPQLEPGASLTPVLHLAPTPRLALVASTGWQIAHHYLNAVTAAGVQYL